MDASTTVSFLPADGVNARAASPGGLQRRRLHGEGLCLNYAGPSRWRDGARVRRVVHGSKGTLLPGLRLVQRCQKMHRKLTTKARAILGVRVKRVPPTTTTSTIENSWKRLKTHTSAIRTVLRLEREKRY